MIVADRKSLDEILAMVQDNKKILIVGCKGCVTVCNVGGKKEVEVLASTIKIARKKDGNDIDIDTRTLERQCDKEYVDNIKRLIMRLDELYKHLDDKCLKWEIVKSEIRSYTIPYCVKKKKERNELKDRLEKNLEELLPELDKNNTEKKEEFYTTKSELENLEKNESMGVILRSKCQHIESGEKNTKFFLGLEKRNFINKSIPS